MIQSSQPISFKVTATWIHNQGLEKQEYLLSIKCRPCLVLGWLNSFNSEGKSCIDITDTSMQPPISAPFVSDRHTWSLFSRANLHEEFLLKGKTEELQMHQLVIIFWCRSRIISTFGRWESFEQLLSYLNVAMQIWQWLVFFKSTACS